MGYGQASGKTGIVTILSILDGVVCVAGFTMLTIRTLGMDGVYWAHVVNGIVTVLVPVLYAADMLNPEDPCKNIGIRMVYRMAKDIRYQNILGLNVLTIKL